ncbi:MAG: acyl-CoA esterase [Betaproteobacteria bacterium]|nr:acyl-CoA esterase [Betaproteobacteria bacterium]
MADFATIDGIRTQYEVHGKGIPLLMMAPSAFDSSLSRWRVIGVWKEMRPLETLTDHFQVIAYDRREAGLSGGRLEPLTWEAYARHAKAMLDHLNIKSALVLGGCMGCSVAMAFAAAYPEACRGMLLHWPVGGYRWLLKAHSIFDAHIAFVKEQGLAAVAERAAGSGLFWNDPPSGPWSAAIASDPAFRASFVKQDQAAYIKMVEEIKLRLFHDTAPSGVTGAQLMAMRAPGYIMPGNDPAHALSASHALRELLPVAQMADMLPPHQTPDVVRQWIIDSGTQAWNAA